MRSPCETDHAGTRLLVAIGNGGGMQHHAEGEPGTPGTLADQRPVREASADQPGNHFVHPYPFQHKTIGETAYLLDRAMGAGPHTRLSPDAVACLLEEAAQGSYEKAGRLSGGEGSVSRETVMRHVRGRNLSPYRKEEESEKRRVKYLYVEADEDHIALQFHKKKGDIKRWKGHGDNSQIVKLVYVHEGYKEGTGKRRQLKEAVYWSRKRRRGRKRKKSGSSAQRR